MGEMSIQSFLRLVLKSWGSMPRWGGGREGGGDYNHDGWRCHLAALLWDIMLVRRPLGNRFYCLWMGRGECVFSAA